MRAIAPDNCSCRPRSRGEHALLGVARKRRGPVVYTVGDSGLVSAFAKRLRRTEVSDTVVGVAVDEHAIGRNTELAGPSPAEVRAVRGERLAGQSHEPHGR